MIEKIYVTLERLKLRYQILKTEVAIRNLSREEFYLDTDVLEFAFAPYVSIETAIAHSNQLALIRQRKRKLTFHKIHLESLLDVSSTKRNSNLE